MTTAFLFLCALVKTLSNQGLNDQAASFVQNYLQIGREFRKSNLRIHSSRLDRTMMSAVVEDLKAEPLFLEALAPYTLTALPSYGAPNGPIRNNYNRFKRFFADELSEGGMDRVRQIYEAFLTLFGRNTAGFTPLLAARYQRLSALGAPSSVLSFTMRLGQAVMAETVSEDAAAEMLDVIESFLVRRAIAGHEPTGLHAVFKRLWLDLENEMSGAAVMRAIAGHKTVVWPDADEVRTAVRSRPLYGAAITPYLLLEFDRSRGGDSHARIETIEHVLPQSTPADWKGA